MISPPEASPGTADEPNGLTKTRTKLQPKTTAKIALYAAIVAQMPGLTISDLLFGKTRKSDSVGASVFLKTHCQAIFSGKSSRCSPAR
jgi:hypothetical protein